MIYAGARGGRSRRKDQYMKALKYFDGYTLYKNLQDYGIRCRGEYHLARNFWNAGPANLFFAERYFVDPTKPTPDEILLLEIELGITLKVSEV